MNTFYIILFSWVFIGIAFLVFLESQGCIDEIMEKVPTYTKYQYKIAIVTIMTMFIVCWPPIIFIWFKFTIEAAYKNLLWKRRIKKIVKEVDEFERRFENDEE